ncbi:MAG: energy-coupling factor ABC transporter ATP-binding protein [Candidatus Aenigmarchaeota archaeon]|nr:energy-coupling factor ABC transporter ATP-binding protein [Candidatus Aenigmarchaeota archaeon]
MKEEIVKVDCLKHVYPDKTEVSVCGLSFVVHRGEKVVLIGPNGSGKTTLLHHIIGLLKATEGEIKVFGLNPCKNFKKVVRRIGVVFQNVDEQLIGPTVWDDIAFSPMNYGLSKKEVKKRVEKIIKELKIEYLKNKIPRYLSGGEKKKVAIAGALVIEPELLVLDEALSELDPESKRIMIRKFNELNKKNKITIVLATNEIDMVKKFADTVYVLEAGEIKYRGSPKEFFKKKIKYEICRH